MSEDSRQSKASFEPRLRLGAELASSADWTLRWSTAGHPPPLVITPDHRADHLLADPDLPLGIDSTLRRHEHAHPLPVDATVVFFTDGLVEHRDHSLDAGLKRLAAIAAAHADLPVPDLVRVLIEEHPSDGHDDMAVLAVRAQRIRPSRPGRQAHRTNPS